jgi:hypothetical protein
MRISLIALFFVLTVQASVAQNIPVSNVFDTQTTVATYSQQPMVSSASAEKKRPRVFDRKFLVLAGIATAATVADVATTSHCIAAYADCREANPLLGSHPSQARLYGVSFSMLGGQLLASAWMRRKTPNGKLWMVPPIIATTGHGLAAALNVRTMHQLSSGQ